LSTSPQHTPGRRRASAGTRAAAARYQLTRFPRRTASAGGHDAPERAMGAPARDVTDVTENIFISRRRDRRVVRRDGLRHVVELATA